MKKLSSQDRYSLIRLANSLPKGSPQKRAILAGLADSADERRLISSVLAEAFKALHTKLRELFRALGLEAIFRKIPGKHPLTPALHISVRGSKVAFPVISMSDPEDYSKGKGLRFECVRTLLSKTDKVFTPSAVVAAEKAAEKYVSSFVKPSLGGILETLQNESEVGISQKSLSNEVKTLLLNSAKHSKAIRKELVPDRAGPHAIMAITVYMDTIDISDLLKSNPEIASLSSSILDALSNDKAFATEMAEAFGNKSSNYISISSPTRKGFPGDFSLDVRKGTLSMTFRSSVYLN